MLEVKQKKERKKAASVSTPQRLKPLSVSLLVTPLPSEIRELRQKQF